MQMIQQHSVALNKNGRPLTNRFVIDRQSNQRNVVSHDLNSGFGSCLPNDDFSLGASLQL